jgi:hypothetical protein
MNYFHSFGQLKIALWRSICTAPRAIPLSLHDRPGHPNHNRTGNVIMRIISERAIALLLALAASGAAFNALIV